MIEKNEICITCLSTKEKTFPTNQKKMDCGGCCVPELKEKMTEVKNTLDSKLPIWAKSLIKEAFSW